MPTTAAKLATGFDAEIADLMAVASGSVGASTSSPQVVRERLLESVFLNAVTALEAFIESLFFKSVTGRVKTGGVKPVMRFRNETVAWQMILRAPREKYLDWLPFDSTSKRAQAFLVDGLPFSRLDTRRLLRTGLDETLIVRNMIAHRSENVREKFAGSVGGRYTTAGEYLAATSGAGSTCEALLTDFVRIANGLCADDEASVIAFLGDEDALGTGSKVMAGSYRCLGCGTVTVVPANQTRTLSCNVCDRACAFCGHRRKDASFRRIP